MPSRLMIAVILVCWLAMTALLIHFEVAPMMLADASPTYQPDITDEIGSPQITWHLKQNGKRAGTVRSRIVPYEDRSFELHTLWHFDTAIMEIQHVETNERVSENRKLQEFYAKFVVKDTNIEIRGKVAGHLMEPRLSFNGVEQKMFDLEKIDVNEQGDVINSMSPISRLRGLYETQTWTVRRFDLSHCINLPFLKSMSGPTALIAAVKSDTLLWDHKDVICFKIEYHEAGKEVTGRTWVRKADGLVLQQETWHLGTEMVLERIP
jgi:hypothetical protein